MHYVYRLVGLCCTGAIALCALAQMMTRPRHAVEKTFDIVLWDTEQTSWEGSNSRRWKGFIPGTSTPETRELLQLSALKATLVLPHGQHTGWQLLHGGSFNILVRPTINPVLSSYVTTLTNISQHELNRTGVSFLEAIGRLHGFADGGTLFSFGNDWSVVEANFELLGEAVPWPDWHADMLDIKPTFEAAGEPRPREERPASSCRCRCLRSGCSRATAPHPLPLCRHQPHWAE